MADKVKIFINDAPYEAENGLTVMQAADMAGFHIPRLCYHEKLSIEGACRVCIVQIEGLQNFVASCTYPVSEGMKIYTNTKELRDARRDIVELILDNHPDDCNICERNGNCELQRLAFSMGIKERLFEGEKKSYENDTSSFSVVRVPDKCILCGRCVRLCSEIQKVNAIGYSHRGFQTVVMPAYNMPFGESVCTNCGQCINVCPTAAFVEKNYTKLVFEKLNDPAVTTVVQVAPAVRAAIGECFDEPPGKDLTHEIAAALRKIGFNYVFDTQLSADLTIMEEASEFLERFKGGGKLPLITSCSSGWIKYLEQFYPEYIENISTCKSPMSMMGALIKTYFADKIKTDPKKIFSVAVMPCTAKKFEAGRPELKTAGKPSVDAVITTRELGWMIKSAGINLLSIKGENFDAPLGRSSGAAAIFGVTGGVMEAAVRTAYELYTGETLVSIELEPVRGFEGIREAELDLHGEKIRVAIAHGLGNAHSIMQLLAEAPDQYQFIEIMGCPGGCIGGGGQPYSGSNYSPLDETLLKKRAEVLYNIDRYNTIRRSHENPDIQKLYKEYLGRPLSKLSHQLLHTKYHMRKPKGIISTKKQERATGGRHG
ncbi:MAG: [FeFe] hydrogenase, group A [Spirochaetes bacterium]|nr:[FeFe] hydrogenase, group A [Spirochaetota bacterium]